MRFIEHGNAGNRSFMLIHGMANNADYFNVNFLSELH